MFDAPTDLLGDAGFRTGLVFGLGAAAAVAFGAVTGGRTRPWAGAAFGTAVVLALALRLAMEGGLAAGLVVLAVAGAWTADRRPTVRMAGAVPGAVVVALSSGVAEPAWAAPAAVAVIALGGVLVAESDRWLGRTGLPPLLLAVTALGVYGTTPDTEHAVVVFGVGLGLVPLGWPRSRPRPLATLGAAGAPVVAALVTWIALVDGSARPGAVVGAIACLGLLVLGPVLRWWRWPHRRRSEAGLRRWEVVMVAALHAGLVAACSRVAGLHTSAAQALATAAVVYAVVAAALVASAAAGARRTAPADRDGP